MTTSNATADELAIYMYMHNDNFDVAKLSKFVVVRNCI